MNVIAKLKMGTQLHQTGQLKEAADVYASILLDCPGHPDALHLSGLIAHQQGNVDHAVGLIKQAIHQRPTNAIYLKNLCAVLTASNRFDEAGTNYRRLVDIVPRDIDAWFGLGNSHQRLGRLDESIEAYTIMWQRHSAGQAPAQIEVREGNKSVFQHKRVCHTILLKLHG